MTQLSRKKKYQELRDRLDEETTEAQSSHMKMQRLSRVDNNLSHASKPLYPHDTVKVSPTVKEMPTSPVMEDLLGEVKQYNIDNGNRITDDTQINILKQLDSTDTKKRNSHMIPMNTDDEDLGSTMKISTYPNETSKLSDTIKNKPKEEKIVLSSNDIVSEPKPLDDDLDLMYLGHDEFDKTEEQPKKKAKSKRKKEKRDEIDEMPSAKIRMKTSDFEKASKHKEKKGSEMVLNIVLAVLIIALLALIVYLVLLFKGKF